MAKHVPGSYKKLLHFVIPCLRQNRCHHLISRSLVSIRDGERPSCSNIQAKNFACFFFLNEDSAANIVNPEAIPSSTTIAVLPSISGNGLSPRNLFNRFSCSTFSSTIHLSISPRDSPRRPKSGSLKRMDPSQGLEPKPAKDKY